MIAFLMSLAACASLQSAADTTTFDVMTFNVRYDNPLDGDHAWDHRKERVAAIMQRADIIGPPLASKWGVAHQQFLQLLFDGLASAVDPTGPERVDPDVVPAPFHGEGAREGKQSGLAGSEG